MWSPDGPNSCVSSHGQTKTTRDDQAPAHTHIQPSDAHRENAPLKSHVSDQSLNKSSVPHPLLTGEPGQCGNYSHANEAAPPEVFKYYP